MAEVTFGAHALRWTARGETGSPVLLLHSSGMTSRQFRRLGDTLATSHRVIAPDLLGCGGSSRLPPGERAHYALDLAGLCRLLEQLDEPAHLVGHSYGGLLALLLSLVQSARVRSLAVYEPVAFGVLHSTFDEPALRTLTRASDDTWPVDDTQKAAWLEGFLDYWNGQGSYASMPESVRAEFFASVDAILGQVLSIGQERTPHTAYETLRLPTLLMRGADTTLAASRVVDVLFRSIPDATRIVVAGAGHMGPLTHPALVNHPIVDHIARVERAPSRTTRVP